MQKAQRLGLMLALLMSFMMVASTAMAQRPAQRTNVGTLVAGLLNVNVSDITVDIETGDITVVNVEDVLNNANIEILNNAINNNTILSNNSVTLTNVLNDNLDINNLEVDVAAVVGVLSGGILVVQF